MDTTITEALADLKTITKRLNTKRTFIANNVARLDAVRDPLAKQGGQEAVVAKEIQSYLDLSEQKVRVRSAINEANRTTLVTIEGVTRSIADWLVWRRDSAEEQRLLRATIQNQITHIRKEAVGKVFGEEKLEAVVNVNETELAGEIERHELILGRLDGILSLTNATTVITIGSGVATKRAQEPDTG